jgi:hypothetical protein
MSMHLNPNPRLFSFAGGREGLWQVVLERLRISEEWSYVDREVEIRLKRDL